MKYVLNLALAGIDGDIHQLVEFAVLAEEAGWDGLSLEDSIVYSADPRRVTFDPWLAMAAIAVRTTRLRLAILVPPPDLSLAVQVGGDRCVDLLQ
jgi:alkanesulfonate monooxygenase SsuD/methylene tetrahydromethanopterin reductase-like flavin-dependent oxidoreductase (luciferase family)